MIADRKRISEYGLGKFLNDIDNIENQYLNLIYDPVFDHVVERWVYEKTSGLMAWKCAICGDDILLDKNRIDVENFVCEKCGKKYNNGNYLVDPRILMSRTKLFKEIEDNLYDELEGVLSREKS